MKQFDSYRGGSQGTDRQLYQTMSHLQKVDNSSMVDPCGNGQMLLGYNQTPFSSLTKNMQNLILSSSNDV